MEPRQLLPGEHALLGFLRRRPMYGYEMARLASEEGLTDVCALEQSALYAYLRNLEERGLVEWTEERVGRRPPRKQYRLNAAGRLTVDRWLRTPVERMRDVRLELLLKLYFLAQDDPEAEQELLHRQIAACEQYLGRLGARPVDTEFLRLVLGSKQSAAEATLSWLTAYAVRKTTTLVPRP